MEKWVVYAFISMLFAGFTSVIAKLGLTGILICPRFDGHLST